MAVSFRLAVCLPSGREFDLVSTQLRAAAEEARDYLCLSFRKQFDIELVYIDEPCTTRGPLQFQVPEVDVVIGPLCSLHAVEMIETWPSNVSVAVSPAADIPFLPQKLERPKLFRVCGDGRYYSANLVALAVSELGSQRPLVVYDATSPWWRAVSQALQNEFLRAIRYQPTMIEFDPNKITEDLLLHGQRPEYYYCDLICYLGNPQEEIGEVTKMFLGGSHRRILYPPGTKPYLSVLLAPIRFPEDRKVLTLQFQPPEIAPSAQTHLDRLTARLGSSPSSYVEQLYDAILIAGDSFRRLHRKGLPREQYPTVIREVDLNGSTGRIQFDNAGNRISQGKWQLHVLQSGKFTNLRSPRPLPERTPPDSFVITPANPFTNIALLRELIRSLQGYIHWSDPHFHRRALEELAFAVEPESVTEIRILSGPDHVNSRTKADFARFAREMMNKGIATEWRVRTDKYAHDRFILDDVRCFNVPPVNTIYDGLYSQFVKTPNRPPFDDWWSAATPIQQFQTKSEDNT